MLTPTVITSPAKEPITVEEACDHAAIADVDGASNRMSLCIKAAREMFERHTGRTVHETTYEFVLDSWPSGPLVLPRATPLLSVTSVTYKDSSGTETTVSSSLYVLDTWEVPGRIALAYSESWPSFTPYPVSPIRVRYVAGIAASPATECDATTKQAVAMLAAAYFENREAEILTENVSQIVMKIFRQMIEDKIVERVY